MYKRHRKLRNNSAIRNLVKDVYIEKSDLIYPIFIEEGENIKCIIPEKDITKEELYKLIKESKQIEFAICKEQKYVDRIEISIKNSDNNDKENPDMS